MKLKKFPLIKLMCLVKYYMRKKIVYKSFLFLYVFPRFSRIYFLCCFAFTPFSFPSFPSTGALLFFCFCFQLRQFMLVGAAGRIGMGLVCFIIRGTCAQSGMLSGQRRTL